MFLPRTCNAAVTHCLVLKNTSTPAMFGWDLCMSLATALWYRKNKMASDNKPGFSCACSSPNSKTKDKHFWFTHINIHMFNRWMQSSFVVNQIYHMNIFNFFHISKSNQTCLNCRPIITFKCWLFNAYCFYGKLWSNTLWNTFVRLLHYVLKCIFILEIRYFRYAFRYNMCEFASKNVILNRYCLDFYQNCEHPWWGIMFQTTTASYFVKIIWCSCWFCNIPSSLEVVYYFICGRQRVAIARYRMFNLVLQYLNQNVLQSFSGFFTSLFTVGKVRYGSLMSFSSGYFSQISLVANSPVPILRR